MGEYAPNDQRTIHENAGPQDTMSNWHQKEQSQREREKAEDESGEISQHSDDVEADRMGGIPGDQQQALDAQVGGPRPEYDQYEVNQPGNINSPGQEEAQESGSEPLTDQPLSEEYSDSAQSAYGNSRNADGQMEQDAIPNSPQEKRIDEKRAIPGEISDDIDERLAADANRPLGQS